MFALLSGFAGRRVLKMGCLLWTGGLYTDRRDPSNLSGVGERESHDQPSWHFLPMNGDCVWWEMQITLGQGGAEFWTWRKFHWLANRQELELRFSVVGYYVGGKKCISTSLQNLGFCLVHYSKGQSMPVHYLVFHKTQIHGLPTNTFFCGRMLDLCCIVVS